MDFFFVFSGEQVSGNKEKCQEDEYKHPRPLSFEPGRFTYVIKEVG